jgi:peptidoglycan/LPS O-acetylase OafA/YrhL
MTPRPPRFRSDLEGLRGVAIVLVVLFHAGVGALNGGFIGVDLFFVLSGFFISAGLARELESTGQVDLNAFWGRRMLRLSPPLLVVLLSTLGLVMVVYAPIDRAEVGSFSRFVAFYSGNIRLAASSRDYFSTHDNPLLHTWSLGVEEQFYLLWPLLLLLPGVFMSRRFEAGARSTRPLMLTMVIAGVASLVASALLTTENQPWAFCVGIRHGGRHRARVARP